MDDVGDLAPKLQAFMREHQQQARQLLEKLVNINSGTMNFSGIKRVADVVKKELSTLGFVTTWVPMVKLVNRAGHLFAQHSGSGGQHLLLIGHLDTVFSQASDFQIFHETEQWASGPGIIDDKGGVVSLLYALKALKSLDLLAELQLTIALMGDEENVGIPFEQSRLPLIKASQSCDVALGFEPASSMGAAVISRRGIVYWRLEVIAQSGHSAKIFSHELGRGGIFEVANILCEFEKQLSHEPGITINPGLIAGGEKVTLGEPPNVAEVTGKRNVIAREVVVEGEFRFLSPQQFIQTRATMEQIVSRVSQQTNRQAQVNLSFMTPKPVMQAKQSNQALLKQCSQVSESLGLGALITDKTERGAGDINFIASQLPCLDGLGPYGQGMHTTQESLDIKAFSIAIQRTAGFIYHLGRTA